MRLLLFILLPAFGFSQDTLVKTWSGREYVVAPLYVEFQQNAQIPDKTVKAVRKPVVQYEVDISVPTVSVAVKYKKVQPVELPKKDTVQPVSLFFSDSGFITYYNTSATVTYFNNSVTTKKRKKQRTSKKVYRHRYVSVKPKPDYPVMQWIEYMFFMKRSGETIYVTYVPEPPEKTYTVFVKRETDVPGHHRMYFGVETVSRVVAIQLIKQTLKEKIQW